MEVYDREGDLAKTASRTNATYMVTDLDLSHDGWLAVIGAGKSDAHPKVVEFVKVA